MFVRERGRDQNMMQRQITIKSDMMRERVKQGERESRVYNSREGIKIEGGESDSEKEKA